MMDDRASTHVRRKLDKTHTKKMLPQKRIVAAEVSKETNTKKDNNKYGGEKCTMW